MATSLFPRRLSKHRGQDRKVFQPVCGYSVIKTSHCPSQGAPWKSPHHSSSSSGSNSKRQGKHLFSKTTIESNSKFCMHKEQRAEAGAGTCRACTRTEQTYPVTQAPISTSPSYLMGWNPEKSINSSSGSRTLFNSKTLYVKYSWNTSL